MVVPPPACVDALGREHFTVDAAPGRLGISVGESDVGFAVVCAIDPSPLGDVGQLGHDWRSAVRVGDRLVQIEGEDIVHRPLSEVISRLGKLAANSTRRLTFARYHVVPGAAFGGVNGKYDVEKLVQIRALSGPLGLVLDEAVEYGAFISAFQPLPDGSVGPVERYHPRVHRGCQIVAVNGTDVSSYPREEIRAMLSTLRDQDKQLVLYRAVPSSCSGLVVLEAKKNVEISEGQPQQGWHGLTFDESDLFRCKVVAVDSALAPTIEVGDIVIAVNFVDVSCITRREAMETLANAASPATLVLSRQAQTTLPECHKVRVESGPLGLNLDSQCAAHAVITGFTTSADANRPVFQPYAHFLPGSFVISMNKLDVHQHSLAEVSQLLMKLRNHAKDIVVGNASLMERLQQRNRSASVDVPAGPLGIDFDSSCPEIPRVAGFFPMADGRPGAVEQSGLVPVGASILQINSLDVSCLSLAQVTDILKKMAERPKTIRFLTTTPRKGPRSAFIREIRIRVPPGPLGIDLKSGSGNRVVVDRLNRDQKSGPTLVNDHGGVIVGSELLAIDGFDVASIGLADVTSLLKALSTFEKFITFSTTAAAYTQMLSPERKPSLKRVTVTKSPLGIVFESSTQHAAVISEFAQASEPSEIAAGGIPVGSQLVAIDGVDHRALSLQDIAKILNDFAGIQKVLTFLLPSAQIGKEAVSNGTPSSSPVSRSRVPASPESPCQRAHSVVDVASTGHKSPLGLSRENSLPPALASLQPLDIRPLDATRPLVLADGTKGTDNADSGPTAPITTEYAVTMSTWTGSRAQYQLSIDTSTKSLRIAPTKPTSPKSSSVAVLPFAEISAVDWGKAGKPSPTKGLFRSASSLTSSNSQRYTVTITDSSGKKRWVMDMRSSSDRDALEAALTPMLPAAARVLK